MPQAEVRRHTKVPEIRKGDTVVVLSGKDAGKRGVVERILVEARSKPLGTRRVWRSATPLNDTSLVVTGLNIAKRHTKARQSQSQTDRMPKIQQGGILELAQPMWIGKVMLVCPHCDKPTRVGHAVLENGRRVRVCHHCGEQLEANK